MQGYLIFHPSYKYFKVENIKVFWKSKGISNEEITSITASTSGRYSSLSQYLPKLIANNEKLKLKLLKFPMKQAKVTYNHEKIVNIDIVYELISSAINVSAPLHNSLYGAVRMIKDSDAATVGEYKYSGYGISFYSKKTFLHSDKKNSSKKCDDIWL